jgi:catabolite regulation protein CreA
MRILKKSFIKTSSSLIFLSYSTRLERGNTRLAPIDIPVSKDYLLKEGL